MDERRKPRQIMEARTEGRRGRGRPRKAYVDKIEDIARKNGKGVGEMKRMATNREDSSGATSRKESGRKHCDLKMVSKRQTETSRQLSRRLEDHPSI